MKQTVKRIPVDGREIILVGTAHISKESIDEVAEIIRTEHPDCVCVELDEGRLQSITNEKGWQELNITKVLKEGKGFLLLANLVLSSFQKRMGEGIGIKPGDEMKEAITIAKEEGIGTVMVDRPIQVTLQRAWAKNSFWGKSKLLAALVSSAFSNEEISAEEIENLKNQGAMDSMMNELADYLPTVKEVLIDERDRYLASHIWEAPGKKIVAVLGAGHLPGTESIITEIASGKMSSDTSDISTVPPKGIGSKIAGWIIPALIVALIVAGFFTGGAAASLKMFLNWILWNGSLAALGTVIALGHPLAVLTAFVGAPIATINPFIGVGLFSGLVQAWARKPRVIDMENLSSDITSVKGFYKNRITHVLLVFLLSSLGGAIGNFIAVPSLIGTLIK
ncbi:TraB/GumN family protein [Brucepastera parasyntrophica]|uniref:TraB/GumN family protein n=1 Tax=Brucepastera parasyntrophica TaxID=2880008 RepID=UPI00210923C0|nr:TraB/GumN family protein [Brucepastera parasyntrophica]ULQ60911.1 TraB/GumN family protein [Brucepastera parasyntrophica]